MNLIFSHFSSSVMSDSLWTSWTAAYQVFLSITKIPGPVQTHVCWVSDAIQISYPLSSPSPPAFNLSQHKGLFQWVSALHQVAKVLELQLQHQPFQWIFRTDLIWCWLFDLPAVQRTLKNLLQHHCRKASILGRSAFLMVQFSHVYITTGKTTVLLDGPLSAKWCLCFLYAV